MRIFKITERIEIVCKSERTRNGFRHLATLFLNGSECETEKCCYLNRTWERYEFESVLIKLVNKSSSLSDEDKVICKKFIDGDRTDWSDFKTTRAIAQLGDLFCNNQKEKNDWKTRMLKAGLGNKGLDIPEDWSMLDENTKEKRLNEVIRFLSENKSSDKEVDNEKTL